MEMIEKQKEPEEEAIDDLTPRGQILWIRGLTRLQHQVRLQRRTLHQIAAAFRRV